MDAKEILEKVTPKIVIDIMQENGSKLYNITTDGRTRQKCLWFQTICHGGDSHKLCYFTETKDFFCYTSCGKMPFYDFIGIIRNIKKDKFGDIIKYVAKKVGYVSNRRKGLGKVSNKDINIEIRELEELSEKKKSAKVIENNITYDNKILNYFDPYTFYSGWIEEGISIKSMYKFNIRWYELEKHIIIPHYNLNGDLVGIRRRSLKPEDSKKKYMPEIIENIVYEHPLGLNLYGLYQNQEAIRKNKRVVIVEAEKSVLLADTYYGKNSTVVATCGFNISEWQLTTLLKLGVEEIVIGFDKDFDILKQNDYKKDPKIWKNYINYKRRLTTICKRIAPYCNTYLLLDKKNLLNLKDAPLDKGKQIYEELLKDKKQISTDNIK